MTFVSNKDNIQNEDNVKTERNLKQKELETLKNARKILLEKKLNYKTVSTLGIVLYMLGLFGIATISTISFDSNVLITAIISFSYAIGIPATYIGIEIKKENKLLNEIKQLDYQIDKLDFELNGLKLNHSYIKDSSIFKETKSLECDKNTCGFIPQTFSTVIGNSSRFPGYEVSQVRYVYSRPGNYKSTITERDDTIETGVLCRHLECNDETEKMSQEQDGTVLTKKYRK